MLIPRKPPKGFRKPHHPDRHGSSKGGNRVVFGEFGIQALEPAYVTNRQIESARIAMTRHIKRGGKVWITIFPDQALTKKPAETRMVPARVRRSGGSRTSSRAASCSRCPSRTRRSRARRCAARFTSCR